MEMKNLTLYKPKEIPEGFPESTLFLIDDQGRDWYAAQKEFKGDTLKVVFNNSGVIVSKSIEVSALWPMNNSVAEVAAADVPNGIDISGNWMFDGKSIVPRTYTAEEWQARAEHQRQKLITAANATMTPWEREANVGILENDDKVSLIEWTKYAKALRKLDISAVKDEAGYNAITWPEQPDF